MMFANGGCGLCDYTQRFDRNDMTPDMLRVSADEIDHAEAECEQETLQALDVASKGLRIFMRVKSHRMNALQMRRGLN